MVLLLASACTFATAQPSRKTPVFVSDSLDHYVQRNLTAWNMPGVSVCIVKDGKVVLQKGFGITKLGTTEKVDEHTLFMIGSNTKAFTGTALALLAQEKKCALDDKVTKYLPDFSMQDPLATQQVNLTDMVTHRLGTETFQGDFMFFDSGLNKAQTLSRFSRLTPLYPFRTKWGYCNTGYLVAAECIEKISGKSWEAYMRENFFKPLQMNRTLALSSEIAAASNKAAAHTVQEGKIKVIPYGQLDVLAAAGSISSSAHDMSHWLIAQLDSGRYGGKTVFPYAALRQTRIPQSIIGRARHPFNTSHYSLYSLGWELQDYEGREIISHTGGVNGFVTSVTLVPEENLGIVVLTNTDENAFYQALKWEIVDAYLGLPYRNYSQYYLDRFTKNKQKEAEEVQKWRLAAARKIPTVLPIAQYEGTYEHDIYGTLKIQRTGKDLMMFFEHHPNLNAKLEHIGDNKFLCTYSSSLYGIKVIPFQVKDKQVDQLTLSVADFVEFTTYDFKRKPDLPK